jgi:hypothetical protein
LIQFNRPGIWDRDGKQVAIKDITDGASKTYFVGEKAMSPAHYTTGGDPGDNSAILRCWRGACVRFAMNVPQHDTAKTCFACHDFGSAHRSSWNMVFCDGSVHSLSYDMDFLTHHAMATPRGEEAVSLLE